VLLNCRGIDTGGCGGVGQLFHPALAWQAVEVRFTPRRLLGLPAAAQ